MRVILLTNYWKGSAGGGVKAYVTNLVEMLEKFGLNVRVIFREGVDEKNIKVGGHIYLFPVKAFIKLITMRPIPEVVHSHWVWHTLLPAIMFKFLFKNVKVIHTFHTSEKERKPRMILKFFLPFFRWMLNRADCITFVSDALRKEFEEIYGLKFKRCAITYAGVKCIKVSEKEMKEFVKKFGIEDRNPILLSLGLTALKKKAEGAKLAMLTIKELREKYPKILLILTRKGKYLEELMDFAKKEGLENNVLFTGDIENPLVALQVADIYVHTPLAEGLPIALLEAMSIGKPIVATAAGGIPEAIIDGENGLLTNPNPKTIAKKIDFLLKNPEYAKKLGEKAKETVINKFSWEKSAEKFIELYKV